MNHASQHHPHGDYNLELDWGIWYLIVSFFVLENHFILMTGSLPTKLGRGAAILLPYQERTDRVIRSKNFQEMFHVLLISFLSQRTANIVQVYCYKQFLVDKCDVHASKSVAEYYWTSYQCKVYNCKSCIYISWYILSDLSVKIERLQLKPDTPLRTKTL